MLLISFRIGVDPRAVVRPEGVEHATFRLVAQCLNQICHRVPPFILVIIRTVRRKNSLCESTAAFLRRVSVRANRLFRYLTSSVWMSDTLDGVLWNPMSENFYKKKLVGKYKFSTKNLTTTSGVPRGGFGGFKSPPPPSRNSEDIGGVLDRMSKENWCLDFLL